MPVTTVPDLRAELSARMDHDAHGATYGVWSVYYDTIDLRFYWEKIEGLRFRRKLRVRHYGDRLKERFLARAAFRPVYEAAYRDLYQRILASGAALRTLDALATVLPTVDGHDASTSDADRLRTLVRQRTEFLATAL